MEMESCVPSFNFNNVWYLIYNKKSFLCLGQQKKYTDVWKNTIAFMFIL